MLLSIKAFSRHRITKNALYSFYGICELNDLFDVRYNFFVELKQLILRRDNVLYLKSAIFNLLPSFRTAVTAVTAVATVLILKRLLLKSKNVIKRSLTLIQTPRKRQKFSKGPVRMLEYKIRDSCFCRYSSVATLSLFMCKVRCRGIVRSPAKSAGRKYDTPAAMIASMRLVCFGNLNKMQRLVKGVKN